MQFQIRLAGHDDVRPWLRLAEEVLPLFGPMPGFDVVLIRKIEQRQAYCASSSDGDGRFAGGVIIGGRGKVNAIRWLAVCADFQRLGVGKSLVKDVIANMPAQVSIHVDTFVMGSPGAVPARRLYESCGFVPGEVWREDDAIRQRYVRWP